MRGRVLLGKTQLHFLLQHTFVMTDSGRTSNLPHEQGHGQILASFIERLMLQPDREPVASELGGADDSPI
jgi:hypothetical protein